MLSAICFNLDQSKILPFGKGLNGKREKEKIMVTSIFSLSLDVFKRLLASSRLKSGLCCKELTLSPIHNHLTH